MGSDFMRGRDFMERVDVPSQASNNAWTDAEGNSTELTTTLPPPPPEGCECTFLHPPEGCPQEPTLLKTGDGKFATCTNCGRLTCWACSLTNSTRVNSGDPGRKHLKCPV